MIIEDKSFYTSSHPEELIIQEMSKREKKKRLKKQLNATK